MFGKEYWKNPEILLSSFQRMRSKYRSVAKKKNKSLILLLQKLYIRIFGIPEIGFQIRSMYFKQILEEKLPKEFLQKILDAGSGIGVYSFWLAKKYPKAKVIGGEIDKEKITFSQNFSKTLKVKNVDFKYFDINRINGEKNTYDLIVNIDVLEHVRDYKKVLKNFYNLLSWGGFLFIHTPQPKQKRIFKSLEKWEHEDHIYEGYKPKELKSELKSLGFKIITAREAFGFLGKLAWELNHISLSRGFIISGLLYPFLFLLAKTDLLFKNRNGLTTAILAQKKK